VVSGPAAGTRLGPRDEPLLLGREADDEGRLGDDVEISRRHARIGRAEDGRLLVEDLGSTNGTFVNGKQIEGPTELETGDTVSLGDTTLKVLAPVAGVHGGVHALPTDLRSVLVARAPVKKEWVIKAALQALPIVLAVNLLIRTFAVEYLDVRNDLATMRLEVLFLISVMPTLGNGVGFYKNFGRPADHSVAHYLIPTSLISLFWATIEVIALPSDATVIEYVVTIAIATVAPTVIVPMMLALRVRAELAAERRLGGKADAKA
jgi:hypothetical protein